MPLVTLINFLWTLGFVQKQLKTIMFITITVSLLNVVSNYFLIPIYGNLGSAVSFLMCTLIQALLYLKFIKQNQFKFQLKESIYIFICAIVALIISKLLCVNIIFTTLMAITLYVSFIFFIKIINFKQMLFLVLKNQK